MTAPVIAGPKDLGHRGVRRLSGAFGGSLGLLRTRAGRDETGSKKQDDPVCHPSLSLGLHGQTRGERVGAQGQSAAPRGDARGPGQEESAASAPRNSMVPAPAVTRIATRPRPAPASVTRPSRSIMPIEAMTRVVAVR